MTTNNNTQEQTQTAQPATPLSDEERELIQQIDREQPHAPFKPSALAVRLLTATFYIQGL